MNDFLRDGMFPLEEAPCPVETPAPRLPEFERPGDPTLLAAGWQRRFMADFTRLAEHVELYTSLGYEVHTEKVPPEEIGPECTDCRLIICRQFVTVYTRKHEEF
jgi:hypothetical protein